MNWIKGRPDDWTKETDNDCPFFSDSTGDPIVCSQRPNDYEAGASAMLAARDKEWVEWIDAESAVIRLADEQGEFANGDYVAIPAERWLKHRKEIGL